MYKPSEERGRDWSYIAKELGFPGVMCGAPEAGRGKEGVLPTGWSVDLPTLSFWTTGLQNKETKHSSCFEPPS